VPKYFHRIRCEAALALASVSTTTPPFIDAYLQQCAVPKLDYLGLFHLFKLFLRYCYDPEDPRQDLFSHTYVPRSNDFTDLPEYFVRKVSAASRRCVSPSHVFQALLQALSEVRFDNGKTPSIIRQFFVDQLRFNDNTSNPVRLFCANCCLHATYHYICSTLTHITFVRSSRLLQRLSFLSSRLSETSWSQQKLQRSRAQKM
jgi:hypothetical protein